MTEDERAELEQLRVENARLKAGPDPGGLSKLAAHANSEAAQYRMIQQGGLSVNTGAPSEVALAAAQFLMDEGVFS